MAIEESKREKLKPEDVCAKPSLYIHLHHPQSEQSWGQGSNAIKSLEGHKEFFSMSQRSI